jgi:hypothetical protein
MSRVLHVSWARRRAASGFGLSLSRVPSRTHRGPRHRAGRARTTPTDRAHRPRETRVAEPTVQEPDRRPNRVSVWRRMGNDPSSSAPSDRPVSCKDWPRYDRSSTVAVGSRPREQVQDCLLRDPGELMVTEQMRYAVIQASVAAPVLTWGRATLARAHGSLLTAIDDCVDGPEQCDS